MIRGAPSLFILATLAVSGGCGSPLAAGIAELQLGDSTIARMSVVAPGAECASGGVRVDTGTDVDGSGALEEAEVTAFEVVCNGDVGAPGSPAGLVGSACAVAEVGDGVNADGTLHCVRATGTDTLNALTCLSGQAPTLAGGAWTCGSDADTLASLTGGPCVAGTLPKFVVTGAGPGAWTCAGDDVGVDTDTLAGLASACGVGQIVRATATGFACSADQDSLALLLGGCTEGQIVKLRNGAFACDADLDALAALSCADGLILKEVGGVMTCAADSALTDTDALGALVGSCASGQVPKKNAAGVFACAADVDTDALAALQAQCAPGQVPKKIGAGFVCADDDLGTDSLGALGPSCATGFVPKAAAGTFVCAPDADTLALLATQCALGQVPKVDATGAFHCHDDDASGTDSDVAADLIPTCSAGLLARSTGVGWECQPDTLPGLGCPDGTVVRADSQQPGGFICDVDVDLLADIQAGGACNDGDVPVLNAGVWACAAVSGSGNPFVQIFPVKAGADPVANGAALLDAVTAALASAAPALVKLEPGVFDTADLSVDLLDIAMEGSGRGSTKLLCDTQCAVFDGALGSLAQMTLESRHSQESVGMINIVNGTARFDDVEVLMNADSQGAIAVLGLGSPQVEAIEIRHSAIRVVDVAGTAEATAVIMRAAQGLLDDVEITLDGCDFEAGIVGGNTGDALSITDTHVRVTHTQTYEIVQLSDAPTRIARSRFEATDDPGGTFAFGFATFDTPLFMSDVSVDVSGHGGATGMRLQGTAPATLHAVRIRTAATADAQALRTSQQPLRMDASTISATSSSGIATLVRTESAGAVTALRGVSLEASGPVAIGLRFDAVASASVALAQSELTGTTTAVQFAAASQSAQVGGGQLQGNVAGPGTFTCTRTYDESFAARAECP